MPESSSPSASSAKVQGRTLSSVPTPTLTDWSGVSLTNKKTVLGLLYPTCIVRAMVQNHTNDNGEALYFEIVKTKDGTVWGKVMDTFRTDDYVELPNDRVFAFPLKDVMEVPIQWQPKPLQRKLERYLDPQRKGRAFTGYEF